MLVELLLEMVYLPDLILILGVKHPKKVINIVNINSHHMLRITPSLRGSQIWIVLWDESLFVGKYVIAPFKARIEIQLTELEAWYLV